MSNSCSHFNAFNKLNEYTCSNIQSQIIGDCVLKVSSIHTIQFFVFKNILAINSVTLRQVIDVMFT